MFCKFKIISTFGLFSNLDWCLFALTQSRWPEAWPAEPCSTSVCPPEFSTCSSLWRPWLQPSKKFGFRYVLVGRIPVHFTWEGNPSSNIKFDLLYGGLDCSPGKIPHLLVRTQISFSLKLALPHYSSVLPRLYILQIELQITSFALTRKKDRSIIYVSGAAEAKWPEIIVV